MGRNRAEDWVYGGLFAHTHAESLRWRARGTVRLSRFDDYAHATAFAVSGIFGLFIVTRRTGDGGFRRFAPRAKRQTANAKRRFSPQRHRGGTEKSLDSSLGRCAVVYRLLVLYRLGSMQAVWTTGRPRSAELALKIDAMYCLDDCASYERDCARRRGSGSPVIRLAACCWAEPIVRLARVRQTAVWNPYIRLLFYIDASGGRKVPRQVEIFLCDVEYGLGRASGIASRMESGP
jgi:hypothetical protein